MAVMAGTPASFLERDNEGHILVTAKRLWVSGDHGIVILAQA